MKRTFISRMVLAAVLVAGLPAFATTKTITWTLPVDWEEGVSYGTSDGYLDVSGGNLQRRYGLGRIGEPDLPTLAFHVAIPSGGSLGEVSVEADWSAVDTEGRLPVPIAEPVPYGAQLVYPTPDAAAYGGEYPKVAAIAGEIGHNAGVTMVPIMVTPFRWNGATKTLCKAMSLTVTVTLNVAARLRMTTASASSAASNPRSAKSRAAAMTINPDDAAVKSKSEKVKSTAVSTFSVQSVTSPSGQILIVSPSEFVGLWQAYAAFRKNTEAGKDFEYIVKDTSEIYTNATLNTVEGDDALAIHHWLETVFDADREQYVILGAAPKKYAYDRATMIPARYVVNQGSLDQVCDMYYGCMDRKKGGLIDSSVEVWDYDKDGTYMGHKNSGGGYSSDSNDNVDWEMDVPVTRVPLMREMVETSGGKVYRLTAAQIMDHFTNKIAFVESETQFDPPKRWRHVLGGGYLFNNYARGNDNYLVEGEREFFDGGYNMFDERHQSPAPDAEACPRDRNFITYSKARAARYGLINTGGLKTTANADLYKEWGEVFDVHCHGWARGADPGSTGGALFATGLFRIYNMALPCESGMYDYCPNGSYGITNCVCMGEAPLLCFNRLGGGAVTFNNSRYGWWGGYNGMSGRMEGLINDAFYGQVGNIGPMNAGEVIVYAHNYCGMQSCGNRGGASNLEVIMHGDPLIRISPQYVRTWNGSGTVWTTNAADGATWTIAGKDGAQPMDYTTDLTVDATGRGATEFDVRDDLAAARFNLAGDAGQRITLDGAGTFRVTDRLTVTGVDLEWRVAGGAGRNGIAFAGNRGNVLLSGNAKRYFGSTFTNVNELAVSGGNVTIDTPKSATAAKNFDIRKLSFVAPMLDDEENYNTLRTRTEGIVPADMTIAVVSNRLCLQTYNIGGGKADNEGAPLFFVTNGYLKVRYNPYWGTEYFVRPTHLTDAHIVGDYDKFGFGRPDSNGYDLYVSGKSSIDGDIPILLNGELRVNLEPGAELEIANPMTDGPHNLPGKLHVMGAGKVRITGAQTFTGCITVDDGCTLELGIAKAVKCDITVRQGGELDLDAIPLDGVKSISMEDGSRLVLAGQTGAGIYQIVDSATSSIELGETACVYDVADTANPLNGELANGYFLLKANLIYWNGASGTWRNDATLKDNWRDANENAIAFTNTMPVVFPSIAGGVAVAVDCTVKPGYVAFDNANSRYSFTGAAGAQIALESLVVGHDVSFGVDFAVNNIFRVMGGNVAAGNIEASLIEVAGGNLHAAGELTVPEKKVKALKFSFASAKDAGNITAIQELWLFNADGWFALPNDTVIEDIAGQKIRITGHDDSTKTHSYEWLSGKPSDENESLKALIDGTPAYNNKWWASKKSAPTWFTITFPTPQEIITGYNLKAADHAPRNPKSWSVSTSTDGTTFSLAATVDGEVFTGTGKWMRDDGKEWPLQSVDGELRVKKGGTLFADGRLAMNLAFEAGATLAVTNFCALSNAAELATLTLPDEEGAVKVDPTLAATTAEAFPVLVGYALTAEDFLKFSCTSDMAVLNLRNGDLYIVTAGIVQSPYTADVTDDQIDGGELTWSKLKWKDKNGKAFVWDDDVNYQSGGSATININWLQAGATSLDIDIGGALGSLTVRGDKAKDPLTLVWNEALVPRALDFGGYLGSVTLDYGKDNVFELTYSDFTAGATLVIPFAGFGALTIAAGMRAVVPGWGDWSKVTGEGTIAIDTAADVPAGWANANGVSGTNQIVCGKWEIANTDDYPKNKEVLLTGSDALLKVSKVDATGYGNYTTGLTIEDGAIWQVAKRDTFNRKLTLRNGGEVWLTADATDSNRALDLFESASIFAEGKAMNVIGGSAATADAETGDKIVNSGIVALRDSSGLVVTVADGAALDVYSQWGGAACTWYGWTKAGAGTMSFYRASAQTGNMNVREGIVRLVNKGQGTTGGIVNQGEVILAATGTYVQQIGNAISGVGMLAKEGTGVSVLSGENTYSGATVVREGTLRIGNAKSLGSTSGIALEDGTLDLGLFRFADKTVTAAAGTKIRVELTADELAGQIQIVKFVADGQPKDYFTLVVNGKELPSDSYDLAVSESGAIKYRPRDFSGYEFPLETLATGAHDWTDFTWIDQRSMLFTSNWSDYASISAIVNVDAGDTAVMALDEEDVKLSQLTIRNAGMLTISNGVKKLTAEVIDLTGSNNGTTRLDFEIGTAALTADGKVTLTRPGTGAMKILENAEVTLEDADERGTVSLCEGSVLRYGGTKTRTTLPWMTTDNHTGGAIAYAMPAVFATGEAVFGGEGDSPEATAGDFIFDAGFSLSVSRLVTGNGTGSEQRFRQRGGTLAVTGEPLLIGKDATVEWTMSGGMLKAIGVKDDGIAGSSFTLAGGTLELGTNGISITKNAELTFAGGTLRAIADATISAANGIVVTGDTYFEAAAGTTLTIASPVSGSGTIYCGGEGTVKFLGDCKNASLAGTLTIQLQAYQENNKDTSSYLFNIPASASAPTVTILGTNGEAAQGGGGVRSNDKLKYHWVPTDKYVQPISATLTKGGTIYGFGSIEWRDAVGKKATFSCLTGDIELQLTVAKDTVVKNADDRTFAKLRINGPGKLTIDNTYVPYIPGWMEKPLELYGDEVDIQTDVILIGPYLKFNKLTGLADGKTLTLNRSDHLGSFGDGPFYGTLTCNNFDPPWTGVFGDPNRWQGTLIHSSSCTLAGEDRFWDEYGNVNSKLELSGYYTGYLKPGGSTKLDLKLNGYLRFQDGYSVEGGYTFAGPLTGVGGIYAEKSPSEKTISDVIQFTGDASEFAGEVEVAGGHCIAFGEQADDDSGFNKIIIKNAVSIAASKKWSAEGGIDVTDGGRLTILPRSGSDLATSSEITVLEDGTLDLIVSGTPKSVDVTADKLSVFGTLCVNGVEQTDYTVDGGTVWLNGHKPGEEEESPTFTIKDAKWGNVGTAEKGGVATDYNRGNYTCAWTVDFCATDNICTTEIGTNGTVRITKIYIAARDSNEINKPGALTISQTGGKSIASATCIYTRNGLPVYKSDGTVIQTYHVNVFTFTNETVFATGEPLTLKFNTATTGVGVIKPKNSKMYSGEWSPIIEITGDYSIPTGDSISINVIGGNAQGRTGKSVASGPAGVKQIEVEGWNQLAEHSHDSEFSEKTAALKETLADGTVENGPAEVTLSGKCTYTAGIDASNADAELEFGYIDDGGTGAEIIVDAIPYSQYDVYVYMGTDTKDKASGAFGPVAVSCDGFATNYPAANTAWGSANATHGTVALVEGQNYFKVSGLTGRKLTINGSKGGSPSGTRCGLAGIQIVNTGIRDVRVEPEVPSSVITNVSETAFNVETCAFTGTAATNIWFVLPEGATQEITGSTTAANRRFGIVVNSGTLNFTKTGGTTTFAGRVVTADGSNAVVRLAVGDATGYSTAGTKIAILDGGTLAVAKRDTLITPVELDGGNVVLKSGCVDSGRGLDLFNGSGNDWSVADDSYFTYDAGMGDGRKVLIRNGNWNIDVAEGGRFTVDVMIISAYSGASGTPGKLVKRGAGELVLTAENTYGTGTVVEEGVVTVASAQALGTGPVILNMAGTINVKSSAETNAYAICAGKITLEDGASIANIRLNGAELAGVWKFNDATNGIVQVIEEKDYPDGKDTKPEAKAAIDAAVENGLINSKGETIAPASDVAAAVKAASAGTSTPEQRRITNTMMLQSDELVGDDVAMNTAIEIGADGSATVTVSGENCALKKGTVVLGYLTLWSSDTPGNWAPSAITEVTADNAATVTPPSSASPSRFFRSSFEWKKPSGL